MRRRWVVVFAAGAVALLGTGCTRATPTTTTPVPSTTPVSTAAVVPVAGGPAGSWGRAIEVPGLAALDKGGKGDVASVSCGSAGNCAAGGYYTRHGRYQGFVVSEANGRWGRAIEVPGLGALNADGSAEVNSVSCGSAGNCAAGGSYQDQHRHTQGFVASETNGRWGRAIEVPGLGALNTGAFVAEGAEVTSVSCASAGNCAAGGYYSTRPVRDRVRRQAFVASEQNGRWGMAIEVPGIAALNAGHYAEVFSVSCGSEGNCAAGGNAASSAPNINGGGDQQGFVVSESNGAWGQAIEVPGLAALNTNGDAGVLSVSCASPANCTAGGNYNYIYNHSYGKGYVVSEKNGTWSHAINVRGLQAVHAGQYTDVKSVSCASPGNCAAGGWYGDSEFQGLVVSENNGAWGRAINVPGLEALNKDGYASVNSVSCAPAGNCVAGGSYMDSHGHFQGFVT